MQSDLRCSTRRCIEVPPNQRKTSPIDKNQQSIGTKSAFDQASPRACSHTLVS